MKTRIAQILSVAVVIGLAACGALLAFSVNCVWSPLLVRGLGVPLVFVLSLVHATLAEKSCKNHRADSLPGTAG